MKSKIAFWEGLTKRMLSGNTGDNNVNSKCSHCSGPKDPTIKSGLTAKTNLKNVGAVLKTIFNSYINRKFCCLSHVSWLQSICCRNVLLNSNFMLETRLEPQPEFYMWRWEKSVWFLPAVGTTVTRKDILQPEKRLQGIVWLVKKPYLPGG